MEKTRDLPVVRIMEKRGNDVHTGVGQEGPEPLPARADRQKRSKEYARNALCQDSQLFHFLSLRGGL